MTMKYLVFVFQLLSYFHESFGHQFTMELAGANGNMPKCYTMDMSTDFVPMAVFSESSQGQCNRFIALSFISFVTVLIHRIYIYK